MHHSLRLSNLNRLPMSSRRIAQAVCDDPSLENIDRFGTLTGGMSTSKLAEFLPVYYCILDPTRIPSSEELEASAPDTISAIKWGVFTVDVLLDIPIPAAAGSDLWPRVWSWVQFQLLFHSVMGQFGISLPSEGKLCVGVMSFSGDLGAHEPTKQVIASTPGFQAFVVRTWVLSLRADTQDTEARKAVLCDIFAFLDPTCFDNIIAGAGGTLQDLAAVVTAHLTVAIRDLDETLSEEPLSHLDKVLNFTVDFDEACSPLKRPLCSALIEGGLMETMTIIARVVSYGTLPLAKAVLNVCLVLLCDMLLLESGYRKLRNAIHGGLLPTILRCAQRNISLNINHSLRRLLVEILPAATVNCNVLADMGTAHMALEGPFSVEDFDLEVWNAWTGFSETLLEHLDVLRTFDTRANVSLKACDNMDCNTIKEKIQLRRCSGCRDLLYCSRECQRSDWREGGHRDQCVVHRTQRIDIELASTPRERAFMHALLHHDYLRLRTYIRARWVHMWAANPDMKCSILFDYRMGKVKIKVGNLPPAVGGSWMPELHESYWADMVARESRSGGCMAMIVMRVRDGAGNRIFLSPLRRDTSEVQDILKRIAAEMGPADTLEDAIRLVVQNNKFLNARGILEIH